MPHALIVDDDDETRAALAELVRAEGISAATAADLREARIHIVRQAPDLVLADLRLPDGNGIDLFRDLDPRLAVEVVLVTGHASVESAVDALRLGAADYLVKPINVARLKAILDRVPRTRDLKVEIGTLRDELRRVGRFGRMLGNSPAMQSLYDRISKVAPTEATVLLIGESGTGKELAAETVHELSLRRRQPFLAVNCGAISPNLIESEMFGHERGSFTGAERQHKGFFERAHGGTLFLDEITEMPVELQVKLLRVLETGVFMRVGTNRETESDVRVIAATNRDPAAAVAEGRLRADLYHRLNVFPLELPPLRERGRDVELIATSLLDALNAEHRSDKRFAPGVLAALGTHRWPGNVRELRNWLQRAWILAGPDGEITEPVPLSMSPSSARPDGAPASVTIPLGTSLAEADRRLILATLERCGGVKRRAAEMLGMGLKALSSRLDEYASGTALAPGDGLEGDRR